MLNVFAQSFMTATRTKSHRIQDVPNINAKKSRWLPEGHWWREKPRNIDLDNL